MLRRPVYRSLLVVVAVAASLLAFAGPASAGKKPKPAPTTTTSLTAVEPVVTTAVAPTLAVVEVTITTTSDWTKVAFAPGRLAATRVISNPVGVRVTPGPAAINLAGVPKTGATVVVRAVYEERSGTNVTVTTDKGAIGVTSVVIRNLATTPFTVLSTTNALKLVSNVQKTVLTRLAVFGTADARLPKADGRRQVLAFYYPWFSDAAYDNPALTDRPADPTASTYRYTDVVEMVQQAKANGIDGFVVSYSGSKDAVGFDNVVNAAAANAWTATAYLETGLANSTRTAEEPADRSIVKAWVADLLTRASSPAFLRSGGVPVVFAYHSWLLSDADWKAIAAELAAAGTPVNIVGTDTDPQLATPSWGYHRYSVRGTAEAALTTWDQTRAVDVRAAAALDPARRPKLFAATVSPGYDDRLLRGADSPVDARGANGERYDETWRAALASDPDWIVINSWNEWYEGTPVQPGALEGDVALRQTATWSARFKGQ